jgi:hypothetical protein
VPTLVKIDPAVLEKKLKMLKSNRQTSDGQTNGDQKSSLELKKFQCILTVSILSPLGEGLSPLFDQT